MIGISTLRRFSNSAWAVLEYAWNPLLVFLCTPFFLRKLGSEKYGLWMMLVATVGFSAVLNAGTGAATIKHISAAIGKKGSIRLADVVSGSLTIALVGGSILAALVVALFWIGDDAIFAKMGNHNLLHLTGVTAAILCWIEQVDNVYASALRGSERYGIAARTEIVAKSSQMALLFVALLLGGQLLTVYAVLLITAIARMSAKLLITHSVLSVKSVRPRFFHAREILHFSKWAWVQGIGGMLFNVSDRFFVGSILGAASLAHYSIVSQLTMQIHGLAAAGVSVIFPMISRQKAGNESFSVAEATRRILLANVLFCSVLAGGLLVVGKPILTLWLGANQSGQLGGLLDFMIVAYWLLALNITPFYILLGLGKVREIAIWVFIGGTAGLIPMVFAIHTWGLVGAGIGKLIYSITTLMLFAPLGRVLLSDESKANSPPTLRNS